MRNLQRSVRVDVAQLECFARRALERVRTIQRTPQTTLQKIDSVAIVLVGKRRMVDLHRRFLGRRGATDVLTFDHGEIVIAPDVARGQARRFGTSLGRELRLYIVHGLLHLHGFDDKEPSDIRKMRAAEIKVLRASL